MKRVHVFCACLAAAGLCGAAFAAGPNLIVHNAKVVTVDADFSIRQAMAVEGGRIVAVGSNDEVLRLKTDKTEVLDLGGKMVMPGMMDSHVHATGAAMTEFDHPIPDMESIADVLAYVRARAAALGEGKWIVLQQVFITRLREQRYPTRAELDEAAPKNPVVFRTGPDASVNSLALALSGIDKDFRVSDGGPGHVEKAPGTGEPTGILRSCTRIIKSREASRRPSDQDRYDRLRELFRDYNSVGLTAICDGSASQGSLDLYQRLLDKDELSVRVAAQHYVGTMGPIEKVQEAIRKVGQHPLRRGGPMLRVIGVKVFLDGGMLTGSAYMSRPWGVSRIYAIDDPEYRGVLFIPRERLLEMVRAASRCGLQFAAHTVGDGAVETLVSVYDELARTLPIRKQRHCITHSNFMSEDTVKKVVDLKIIPLVQPAWLYLDARTLAQHFGYDRLRWFQPLRSILDAGGVAAGGSDHMQKLGSLRSNNPYDPFLGIWTAVTRRARWYEGQLHGEQALTREQAIRFYTVHCARAMFLDNETGSLETGKAADFLVLDTDLLTCADDAIRQAKVLRTYLDGKLVFKRP
ncbi:MAG: N-substituted formamide deformylase precursor [Planctomycetes bacterium ADurb.Bin126]|nr:MAG: N-substituted formamide deformylase precursor [Planctomycetes bacterium ADurb.Bin126]HOD83394.1 amidohydrolase [Phycisphaerae bacterium]HQL74190.1 amidohydrolase [Phycisphaerae bacterium]